MARFPRRLRGYHRGQVDAVLARVTATLGNGERADRPITAEEIRLSRFATALRGYDRRTVDDALLEHIRELEAYESNGQHRARRARGRAPKQFTPAVADWLVGWITSVQFSVVRMRTGYTEQDVDAFLARVAAGLRGEAPPVSARDVRESRFRTERVGAGYDEREVDRFLTQLAAALDGLRKV